MSTGDHRPSTIDHRPRVVAFAYHAFGHEGLLALLRSGADVRLVLTHADHPGENCWWESVEKLCRERGIPVLVDADLKDEAVIARIREARPDFIFSFYFRHLIAERVLALAPRGAFNLHGSLLPRFRGRSPLNWQLVHGERTSGLTLHRMVRRADAGEIVAQQAVDVHPHQDAIGLARQLLAMEPGFLDRALSDLFDGRAMPTAQDESRATYFGGRTPADGRIDWSWPARRVHDLVRAVARPYPGAFADLDGRRVLVWRTRVVEEDGSHGEPGTILPRPPASSSWRVACGRGVIELVEASDPAGAPSTPSPLPAAP